MSSVLVVVIVGVVIAVIVGATMQEGKPATPESDVPRAPEPVGPTAPAAPAAWAPAELAPLRRGSEPVVDEHGRLGRLRAAALLAVTVVVLGSLAAGGIGGGLYLGVHVLNAALK